MYDRRRAIDWRRTCYDGPCEEAGAGDRGWRQELRQERDRSWRQELESGAGDGIQQLETEAGDRSWREELEMGYSSCRQKTGDGAPLITVTVPYPHPRTVLPTANVY